MTKTTKDLMVKIRRKFQRCLELERMTCGRDEEVAVAKRTGQDFMLFLQGEIERLQAVREGGEK